MRESTPILTAANLSVTFHSDRIPFQAVKGISFTVRTGETLCLVGPSGCGKTVTTAALLGLLAQDGASMSGMVCWNGVDYVGATQRQFDAVRGKVAALIQQEPAAALDPVRTVGWQVEEVLRTHTNLGRKERRAKAAEMLAETGLPDADRQAKRYPHQLSGGMCQRAMIAIALASQPQLLIADEPTTALDATIQVQILELLKREKEQRGMALLLITHDMGVAARMADRVAVMSHGEIVEQGSVDEIFSSPQNAVTKELLSAAEVSACKGNKLCRKQGREQNG